MAKFCSNCGAQMEDNLMFCGNCGAKADAAPVAAAPVAPVAAPATTAPAAGSIDFMGILKGTADAKTNWIAALIMQVLSTILFLVPLFAYGKGKSKETITIFKTFQESNGLGSWVIVMFVVVILAMLYMAIPVIRNTRLVPSAALVMAVTQAAFFLSNFIFVVKVTSNTGIGVTFGFWAYLILSLAALFFVGRIIVANKNEYI